MIACKISQQEPADHFAEVGKMAEQKQKLKGITMEKQKLKLFEDKKIRTAWNAEEEDWYFSVIDVIEVLTDSIDYQTARKYWNKLKQRLKEEGNETVTNCHQLKLVAQDSKLTVLTSS